jgi:hypothetical protein
MALTLMEAAKRVSGETKRAAVIEMFASNSDLLRAMTFEDIPGDALSYNVEAALPGVAFRGYNEGYSQSTGIINPEVERLRIIGGDLDVDRALLKTRGEGIRTQEEAMKIKAVSLYLTDRIINGDSTLNVREFDGLRKRVVGPALFPANLASPSANSPLSLEALDAAIDYVEGANAIIVNKAMKRKLSKAARANVGGDIEVAKDEFGFRITMYNDIPMIIVDFNQLGQRIIDFNEAGPAGGTTSTSVYVANLGPGFVQGIQNGTLDVEDLGQLEALPVMRTRMEWLIGMAVMHGRSIARVWGVTQADVTT